MSNIWLKPSLFLGLSINLSAALAVEQHDGDIQPWKQGGQIELNGTLFEADFGDLSGGAYRTDDPGYDADSALGAFGAGNWLWFEGIGSLQFWDGSAWSNSLLNGEHIEIEDALGNISVFSENGISNGAGVIGQFDTGGDIHEHLDMAIRNAGNALGGSVGAYWITLQLFETVAESQTPLAVSSTYDIIFNRGLTGEDFEAAVAAASATAPVPLPAAAWMFGSVLMGWLYAGRRRHAYA